MKSWKEALEEFIHREDWNGALIHLDQRMLRDGRENTDSVASLLVLRAQLLRELGQHLDAANIFRRAGELRGPKLTIRLVALFEGAREFLKIGSCRESLEMLTLALANANTKDNFSEPLYDEGVERSLQESSKIQSFDSAFDPAAPAHEVVGRILLLRAQAARLCQSRDLALQDLTEIVGVPCMPEPLRAAAFLDRGVIKFENGEASEAIEDLLEILAMKESLDRQKCDANYNLSLIYAGSGFFNKSIESFSAFSRSPLPPIQMKKALAESLSEILAVVETDEAAAAKEFISSFLRNH